MLTAIFKWSLKLIRMQEINYDNLTHFVFQFQIMTDEAKTWWRKIRNYFSDAWNRIDQAMYLMLALAIILRYTLTDDFNFEWARNVYAIDLVMFYLRILQFYFVEKRLGPKVIMIRRMVYSLLCCLSLQ